MAKTSGLILVTTGRLFIGTTANPITKADGTGGTEVLGVADREFVLDLGFELALESDDIHWDVVKRPSGPVILKTRAHDGDAVLMDWLFSVVAGASSGIMQADDETNDGIFGTIAARQLLVVPTDATKQHYIYMKAAKPHPDTMRELIWATSRGALDGEAAFTPTSKVGDDGKLAWMRGSKAEIDAHYFP